MGPEWKLGLVVLREQPLKAHCASLAALSIRYLGVVGWPEVGVVSTLPLAWIEEAGHRLVSAPSPWLAVAWRTGDRQVVEQTGAEQGTIG